VQNIAVDLFGQLLGIAPVKSKYVIATKSLRQLNTAMHCYVLDMHFSPLSIAGIGFDNTCGTAFTDIPKCGGGKLDFEPTAPATDVNARVCERRFVDNNRQTLTMTKRADGAQAVTRGTLGFLRVGHARAARTRYRSEALEVELIGNGQYNNDQIIAVELRDQRFEDAFHRESERCNRVSRTDGFPAMATFSRRQLMKPELDPGRVRLRNCRCHSDAVIVVPDSSLVT